MSGVLAAKLCSLPGHAPSPSSVSRSGLCGPPTGASDLAEKLYVLPGSPNADNEVSCAMLHHYKSVAVYWGRCQGREY